MAGQRRVSTIDVDDRRFQQGFRQAVKRLKLKSEADVLRLAIDIQNRARELCPVKSGRLRSSIIHVPGHDRLGYFVRVGTNVEYAPYVEFGTSKMAAQPFMRPAIAEAIGYGRARRR